jgi:hypothetical protein
VVGDQHRLRGVDRGEFSQIVQPERAAGRGQLDDALRHTQRGVISTEPLIGIISTSIPCCSK